MSIKSQCSRIMFYTGAEAILYQALLCCHQIMLFRTADHTLYGQAGALFSAVFLLILYFNAGLDVSLAPLYNKATANKNSFKRLIGSQILGATGFIAVMCVGTYLLFLKRLIPTTFNLDIPPGIIALCAFLILIESTKKTLRTILHLGLMQKTVAFVEIATLFLYVSLVWGYIFTGNRLNLYVLFIPMVISSIIALMYYSFVAFRLYAELSDTESVNSIICWKSIGYMRLKNWLYQIVHSLYSSNFLVLAVAKFYGFELAALLKIISFCLYSLNYIVQHVFGIASNVLFAHAKGNAAAEMQHYFANIRARVFQVLLICPVIVIGYYWYLFGMYPDLCNEHMHIITLFIVLLLSENMAVAHEQYYLVSDRTHLLIACNVGLLIPSLIVHQNICAHSPALLLYMLLAIRCCTFLFLHFSDRILNPLHLLLFKKYKLLFVQK